MSQLDTKSKSQRSYRLLYGIIAACCLLIAGAIFIFVKSKSSTELATTPSLVSQQAAAEAKIDPTGHSINDPLVILDPYDNSPLSAIIAFTTDTSVSPKLTIAGKDDKTTVNFTFGANTTHILPIYGLYADTENQIIISYSNTEKTLTIKTAPLPDDFIKAEITTAKRDQLGQDWYFFTPSSVGYTAAYDLNGDVRWYLKNSATWDNARLANGHLLVSTERLQNTPYYLTGLYEIDLLGKIYREYSLPGGYHHDFFEMKNGNFLIATDDFTSSAGTVEDIIAEIDRETGAIVKTFDLKDILPQINTGNENWSADDWFHNNSVWYDSASNVIILSGRHADAVVAIDYTSGKLKWILGDPTGWPSEYQKYFFTPKDDNFEWQWSQHAAMVTPEGYIFLFDNGNNKSKIKAQYTPASKSYSRGVMYKIDTKQMTIEQVWQYGKERGSSYYSPYISDVDYLAKNRYLVHSGGISYKDGAIQNQPAGLIKADQLVSYTTEILNNQVVFELKLPTNNYRAEKLPAYTNADKSGLQLGAASRLGSLGETKPEETKTGNLNSIEDPEFISQHHIKLEKQEDRLVFMGTFKRNTFVRLVLKQGDTQRYYRLRITDQKHAALCIAIFEEEKNANEDELNVTRYITTEGLSGSYEIYLEAYDKIYDLHQTVKF